MSTLPVTILTGFLGSGKTTLMNHLLVQPGLADTAVLINEFGEIGLDHLLVTPISEDVVQLNSGCLCCTVRGDMVDALRDLYIKRVKGQIPDFQRVLIETTGLADPTPIIHTLMTDQYLSAYYRLDGIVTTVDAVNGAHTLDNHAEAVKQAAVADRLLLTKCDLADYDRIEVLHARLRHLNPAAPIIRVAHGQIDPDSILNAGLFVEKNKIPDVAAWLQAEAYDDAHHQCGPGCGHDHHHGHGHGHGHHHHHGGHRHDDRVQSFVYVRDQPVQWQSMAFALQLLISQRGENLLRIKGILNVAGEPCPMAVHGVQHIFHPPVTLPGWPDDNHTTRIVFITRDLDRRVIVDMLDGILDMGDETGLWE